MAIRISNPVHLTVLDPIDLGFVTRSTTARRPAGEILYPFGVGGSGGIDFTTDSVRRAVDHIQALIMTRVGERAMRPNYGSEIWSYVFEPAPNFASAELASRLSDAIARWEPSLRVLDVTPALMEADGTYIAVMISFTIAGFNEVHSATFDLQGNRIEI